MAILLCFINAPAIYAQSGDQSSDSSLRWDAPELRFVTEGDYPPFNYFDEDGSLTGFNVDLARAICLEMEVRCEIKAVPWNNMIPALQKDEADAAIASLAINKSSIKQVDFSNRYFNTHARFAMRAKDKLDQPTPEDLSRYTIGVMAGTAHEAYLKDFFIYSTIKPFKTPGEMYQALKEEKVDVIFGDGITLMFWLNGTNSGGCCRFFGQSFTEARYFGEGIAVAVAKGNKKLRVKLNLVLEKLRKTGRYEELILRYFPLGL
ncbi:MAG: transporter substrate-binding domain-containing protein [Methyloligellaceae bacterium]